MLDYILTSPDGWTVLKVIAVLVPVLTFFWIIMTVMALHRREVYFWSLGSTWAKYHRLSHGVGHHVPQLFEPVPRPERASLQRADHGRSHPLRRRIRVRDLLLTTTRPS
jgi:hypothetical protein